MNLARVIATSKRRKCKAKGYNSISLFQLNHSNAQQLNQTS